MSQAVVHQQLYVMMNSPVHPLVSIQEANYVEITPSKFNLMDNIKSNKYITGKLKFQAIKYKLYNTIQFAIACCALS